MKYTKPLRSVVVLKVSAFKLWGGLIRKRRNVPASQSTKIAPTYNETKTEKKKQ